MNTYRNYRIFITIISTLLPIMIFSTVYAEKIEKQYYEKGSLIIPSIDTNKSISEEDDSNETQTVRIALVIGNAAYTKAGSLSNPENDARDMADILTILGFDVILKVNADQKSMNEGLREFRQSLKEGGVGLFYYSGHGLQVNGINYLIPIDANIQSAQDIEFEGVSIDKVIDVMRDADGMNIIMLDACRNDPFTIGVKSLGQGLAKIDSPPGFLIAFATSPNDVALEDPTSRNSVYTKHALAVLRETPYLSITDIFIEVTSRVVYETNGRQRPWQSVSLTKNFYFAKRSDFSQETNISQVFFDPQIPNEIINSQEIVINGEKVRLDNIDLNQKSIKIQSIDNNMTNPLRQGVNYLGGLAGIKGDIVMWFEENKLQAFSNPYPNSYAILIAIDDYDRVHDPLKRGKTGFRHLDLMVTHSEELKIALQKVGFPATNIQTFYNQEATFENIEKAIQAFWQGGKFESADRLFLYFGGHGDIDDAQNGYLITYDFDPKKPALTSISMEDLTSTYARKIRTHHVMVAIDACHAGLAVYKSMDKTVDEKELNKFQTLSLIRADTKRTARNVLLAGTGDQKALWENGGIFTIALIKGLTGAADTNHDNIVQFQELGSYVRNEVICQASIRGVQQEPEYYIIDRYGAGRVLFILPPQ